MGADSGGFMQEKSKSDASQPFVDQGHMLHDLFPPREYAIKVPAALVLLGVTIGTSFLGLVLVRGASNAKARAAAKSAADAKKQK